VACSRKPSAPPPLVVQVAGLLELDGLTAPVRVVRDRWGVPHIFATTQDDLFFAQGFVQAQDRLFQLDLWRRSVQGRLAEVLGANFIERDAMTRRMQYRGDMDAEWASYGPDTKAIASAFVRGINAWVAIERERPSESFILAGWRPELWKPEDLLNRSEAFTMTGNALAEIFRARIVAAVGARRAGTLLPLDPAGSLVIPRGLDPSTISDVLAGALKRIAPPPFFTGLAAPVAAPTVSRDGSNNWVVTGARSNTGHPLLANDPHRNLDHPSLRYLVHLKAPGWNVIGSVVPWFPGVAIGHNDRIAWGLTIFDADVQDVYVEKVNPANPRQAEFDGQWIDIDVVKDSIIVKGRSEPFEFERQYTRHGVIIATDRERHLAFALKWTGAEPGTAGYLGALAIDRAQSWPEFRGALARWKLPGENFVYADVDGNIGFQSAALTPVRDAWNGTLPVPGWSGAYEWRRWYSLDDLPHAFNPPAGYLATANNNTLPTGDRRVINFQWSSAARINRLRDVFATTPSFDVGAFERLQHDAFAWNAAQLVPLLARVRVDRADVEQARMRLLAWDKWIALDSPDASLYVLWESALLRRLIKGKLEPALAREYANRVDFVVVPALTRPTSAWFSGQPVQARDALLAAALTDAYDELRAMPGADERGVAWGRLHAATFKHPLAISDAARRLFNVGPFARPGYADTVMATYGSGLEQSGGASFREVIDVGDWDRSVATSAPGQSGHPRSAHFSDLAALWAEGRYFPLAYSDAAIEAATESTLTLQPRR
jgi:penicillin amidase